jgi:hypothetical protein
LKGKDMCDFFSFVICSDGKVLTGNGESHEGISKGWNLERGSYREAEWIREEWDSLSVRIERGEDKNFYLASVSAVCPTKKRSDFLKLFTLGKNAFGVYHLKDGKPHRTDGPAIEWADGGREWWIDNKRHRTDGPACEWINGSKSWYAGGERHRTDGPACEWADGSREWWADGKRHRTDGPAYEYVDGSKAWWVDGKFHRTDGPAIERADGSKEWWVDDKRYSKEKFDKLTF